MAEEINKKITVDIDVNNDGQQQIDKYKTSFDSLRASINNLGKPLSDLSKSIGSLDNDLAKLAAANEKQASKTLDVLKKLSAQRSKLNAESNQRLNTSLSEAEAIKEDALINELALRNTYYGKLGLEESKQYAMQKRKLDDMLKNKGISQELYNKAAEQILSEHYNNLLKITGQYLKDDSGLQASSITQVNSSDLGTALVSQVNLALPKLKDATKKAGQGIFKDLSNGFKKLYANVIGYYKKSADDQTKISKDSVDKISADTIAASQATDKKVSDNTKTAQDKRTASILDNEKKIQDSITTIVTNAIDARAKKDVAVQEDAKNKELANTSLTAAQQQAIKTTYQKKEAAINNKAFKEKQKLSIAQAIINGAISITKAEADLGPIAGTIAIAAIVADTALQISNISKQKPPAMAKGGYFKSDGKGAVLPGYSRTDDTNAWLRSGEAVVVSEAMRDPWARNLVSAINVAYGGRDFSLPAVSKGYAVGGIFSDGGNANRYYNQPVNDQKNLANTVAYQMINNFPLVYVDVKDVNNQQNILAQTINRVNL